MPSNGTPHGVWTELRVNRDKNGDSLTSLASRSKISLSHLSDLERGRRLPTPDIYKKLSRALNVPISVLERKKRVDDEGNDVALIELIRKIVREELIRGAA
ncbi:helix-turn-helix domain-containing protein [Mycobacteroides abscessus]|uniref:helix-turn-helix domain-containing protein n=1 Tax=Mycobacteroides abscessus TaxID=36809 RepID=UPI0005E39807|nr:helix-turn-helix transcriptional regulator [Mycobacteroides abscessus]AMU20836.1 hypothetical protein A3N95_08475 [Mycobacteroides abscessus]CPX29751.1 conjugal transfer protein TrbA [Mycobacteroides abscessus]SKJ41130.1 conjugal transfer protein TrbA [Mycobacteroides abscessus subsp. massiliense]